MFLALFCFGRALLPPGPFCDTPECFSRPYAQDPQFVVILIPGAVIGLLGITQIRLNRRRPWQENAKLMRTSFACSAIASVGHCLTVAFAGAPDLEPARVLVALTSVICFFAGLALALLNIGWSLTRNDSLTPRERET